VDDDLPLDQTEQGLEEGEVDPLTVEPGVVVAAVEGGEDGVGAHQAGHGVAVREPRVDGRAVGKAGQVDDTAACLTDLAEAGGVRLRGGGAEARDLQQHRPGVDPVHGLPVEPPVPQASGAQGDDDDVRPGEEPVGDASAGLVVQIEGDRALVAAGDLEPQRNTVALGTHAAGRVPGAGGFHVHDVGPLVGEHRARQRTGHHMGELDHLQPAQLPASGGVPLLVRHRCAPLPLLFA
jgi:hypothetical protein